MDTMARELISLRQENGKTFDAGGGRRQIVVSIGSVHYKDNYASDEPWKDIDLTWENGRITKAPFELTLEGNKATIRNKKTGEVSSIELLEVGGNTVGLQNWNFSNGLAKGQDAEIKVDNGHVRYSRILKSDSDPKEAKYRVVGEFHVRAHDADGEQLPVEFTLKNGILIETLKPDRVVKYNVRIDPTWQVSASTDDALRYLSGAGDWSLTVAGAQAGGGLLATQQYGTGMRFQNIAIPQGATITSAKLTFRARADRTLNTVNTRISAEDVDDAPTFADNAAAFDARWAARTTARVDWDAIAAWIAPNDYDSPEIKTIIQEIVDRGGWASGQDMVLFWEDFDARSTPDVDNTLRQAQSWDADAANAPKLVATYTDSTDYPESCSVIIGAKPAADREVGVERTSAVIVGIKVAASHAFAAVRSSLAKIGTLVSASRILISTRSMAVIVGNLVSVTKVLNRLRASIIILGVVFTASRVKGMVVTVTVVIGIIASVFKPLSGKIFQLITFTRSYKKMVTYTRPYRDMEVYTK